MRTLFTLACAAALTACGSDQPEQTSGGVSGEDGAMTSTPISFADATGENSEPVEAGECPFASDEVIKASVKSSFEINRQEVSNTNCRWAHNAGFMINITIEDLATAKPVAQRRYNMDIDPVLEAQIGPGTNATVLNDTAFDKPVPYAYSFEKDGKLVFMSYTGFRTNAAIMRPAADEIASRMGSTPEIAQQQRELLVPFEACKVWSESDLTSAFGAGEGATIAPGASGTSNCSWDMYEEGVDGRRTVAFNISKPKAGEKQEHEYGGYEPFTADGETHYLRESDSEFGMYIHVVTPRPEGLVHTTVSDANSTPTDIAKALHMNLLGRMVP